jgi:hypothetical protein
LRDGKPDLAVPLLQETLELMEAGLGRDDPSTLDARDDLGNACRAASRLDEALSIAQETLELRTAKLGLEHASTVNSMIGVAMILLDQGAFAEAVPVLRECLAIREKTMPDDWSTFSARTLLGRALLGQKNYAKAEPLLRGGYEGMKAREKTIPPEGSTRIPEALDGLIELYTATNQPDELTKWQAEREKYSADELTPTANE